jgi:radical SAM protein with 4Fe4S-binding SPASM domain
VLNENIKLQEEPEGAVLINTGKDDILFFSPFEAFILALFDGIRTVEDIAKLLKSLKNSPDESELIKDISCFIENNKFINLIDKPLDKSRIQIDPYKFLLKQTNLLKRPNRLQTPFSVELYVTRRCNLNCVYCFANADFIDRTKQDQSYEMPLEKMFGIIDQLADMRIKSITLTGGEATLRPDLPKIIKHITDKGIKIHFPTNAYSINDELAQKLKQAGLEEVQTKLDAANPEIQDKLSRVNGSYEHLIKGIEILKRNSFKVSTVSVVTSWNIKEIPKVIDLCADLGVDEVIPRIYTPGLWSQHGRGGAYLNPSLNSIAWLEDEIKDLQEKYNGILSIKDLNSSILQKNTESKVPLCPGFISTFVILENGLAVPCEMMADSSEEFVIGDATKNKLIDIWNSEKAQKWVLREDLEIGNSCISCNEFKRCKAGCAWKAIVAYGSWLCDPTCIKAPRPTKIPFVEIPT